MISSLLISVTLGGLFGLLVSMLFSGPISVLISIVGGFLIGYYSDDLLLFLTSLTN